MITDNIKDLVNSLNLEELKELKKIIKERMTKEFKNTKMVIYKHDCFGSSNYHFGKRHWCKLINDIDDTKTNGYAFNGEFLYANKENLVPINSYVVELCSNNLRLYLINGDEDKTLLAEGEPSMYISFIRKCKEEMEESK